jgi:hypothetical protein
MRSETLDQMGLFFWKLLTSFPFSSGPKQNPFPPSPIKWPSSFNNKKKLKASANFYFSLLKYELCWC